MRKSFALFGAIGLVGTFGATAWWLLRPGDDKVAIREQLPAESAKPRETPSTPGNFVAAQQERPDISSATSPAASADVPAKPAATASKSKKARMEEDLEQLRAGRQRDELRRRDPAYRKAREEEIRRGAERTRADAIRVAGMTSEQVDRMLELWEERGTRVRELIAASDGQPAEEFFAEVRRLQSDYEAQLRDLLEPEKYERWEWYRASQAERLEAKQFQAQHAASGGEPIQPSQLDALVEVLYVEERRRDREYEEYVRSTGLSDPDAVPPRSNEWQLAMGKARNKRIHDAMADTLTPAQLASLDQTLAKKLEGIEEAMRYNAALARPK